MMAMSVTGKRDEGLLLESFFPFRNIACPCQFIILERRFCTA